MVGGSLKNFNKTKQRRVSLSCDITLRLSFVFILLVKRIVFRKACNFYNRVHCFDFNKCSLIIMIIRIKS